MNVQQKVTEPTQVAVRYAASTVLARLRCERGKAPSSITGEVLDRLRSAVVGPGMARAVTVRNGQPIAVFGDGEEMVLREI